MPPRAALETALSDRYRIDRELGAGGMATVYLARDLRHDRPVALKVLKPELGAVLGADRFLSEIRVTANLRHPNLLPLFDSGEADGHLFYTMPYVEGESLRARIERERQLPVDEAIRIVSAIAGALDYAHRQGVIHRDLKPENILLQEGQPVVADFGIALAVSNAGGERVTQTGLSLGTPQYMSPEQATGDRAVDGRTDQFSLAAVLYELLTGEPPHSGGTSQAIIARVLTETPRPIRATRPSVPAHVEAAVLRALAKIPADRFPTTREFAAALSEPSAHQAAKTPARGRLLAVAGITALVAVVGAALAVVLRGGGGGTLDPQMVAVVVPEQPDPNVGPLSTQITDAITQGLSEMSWIKPALLNSVDAAKKSGAATVITFTLTPTQDSASVQVRVLNAGNGLALRSVPAVRVGFDASSASLHRAIDPALTLAGFASNPNLGVVALPSGAIPNRESFNALAAGLGYFGSAFDTLARNRASDAIRRAIVLDSGFTQAKAWLGVVYGWYLYTSRVAGGAAETERLLAEIEKARGSFTPYENLLADLARALTGESGEAGLETIRRLAALAPDARIANALPGVLLDANRPREALARLDSIRSRRMAGADSSNRSLEARYWFDAGEIRHFLREYEAALDAYRRARTLLPNDINAIRGELNQLAALGRLDEFRRVMDELPSASSNDRMFAFAGDVYLNAGQELVAHGHPDEGRAVIQRGVDWFAAHPELVAQSFDVALRQVIALDAVGRQREAIPLARALMARDTSDSRSHGYLGRMYVTLGDSAGVKREIAWLRARPAARLQGATTYELAAINTRLGPAHWDEAVVLLEESLRQGQGFGIRRRVHFFADWLPLKDYPAFKRVLEPRG